MKLIVNKGLLSHLTAATNLRLAGWAVPLLIAACCVALGLGGEAARTWGRYQREAFEAGQFWRLLTAHLVHLGWGHLWLNLVALFLISVLLQDLLSAWEWLGATIAAALAIDLGLYLWDDQVLWYVGLSGVLHAVVTLGAVKLLKEHTAIGALLAVGLVVKLIWEQVSGPIPFSESSSGGPVIVAAHLYGVAAGAVVAAASAAVQRRRRHAHDL